MDSNILKPRGTKLVFASICNDVESQLFPSHDYGAELDNGMSEDDVGTSET